MVSIFRAFSEDMPACLRHCHGADCAQSLLVGKVFCLGRIVFARWGVVRECSRWMKEGLGGSTGLREDLEGRVSRHLHLVWAQWFAVRVVYP